MKKYVVLPMFLMLLVPGLNVSSASFLFSEDVRISFTNDFDPLVDLEVTIDFLAIRALDSFDQFSPADFLLEVVVNDEVQSSVVWDNHDVLYDAWNVSVDVPDDVQLVEISFSLWEQDLTQSERCDIGDDEGVSVQVWYDVSLGRWFGDDTVYGDGSGYGRVCGCSDGSIYKDENDAEVFFRISQNDFDSDGLPYWVETEVYGTDPMVDDRGSDNDSDDVPIEWEHYWGFNPFLWEDHAHLDPDDDSLTNYEEYLTWELGADPFRRDVFLELDYMTTSPDGVSSVVPYEALELLKNPFHRRNIVFHVDTGVVDGGDSLPYDDQVDFSEVRELYNDYFLHQNTSHWKRGVFHYGLFVYHCIPRGYAFSGDVEPYSGYIPGTNGFVISSAQMERNARRSVTKSLAYFYGSAIMHEMGHNFGMRWGNPPGCDAQRSKYPWQLGYYLYRTYKSIMNYRYTYNYFDYSDGSHGRRDHDDWEAIDLSYFEIPTS